MGENSAISWTDHTFNPWWGCTKVGTACANCYAETFDRRVGGDHWGPGKPRRLINDWSKPRKWNRKAAETGARPWVFCASMADVFDNEVPPEWRSRLWDLIRETPHLNWIIVTKRIGNAAKMVPVDWSTAYPHVILCITVANQDEADRDVPKLLRTPAARRGISAEPLLGPIDFGKVYLPCCCSDRREHCATPLGCGAVGVPRIDWIVVGGESGPKARPMAPEWARSIRDQCAAAGVPFHFKQWGEFVQGDDIDHDAVLQVDRNWVFMRRVGKAKAGRLLDGQEHNGMPHLAAGFLQ